MTAFAIFAFKIQHFYHKWGHELNKNELKRNTVFCSTFEHWEKIKGIAYF